MRLKARIIPIISLTLLCLLLAPLASSIFAPNYNTAYADGISERRAYQGLALTLLAIYAVDRFSGDSAEAEEVGNTVVDYNNNDLEWLARAVHGEARGEPYDGQVAVAAVILNRVQDDEFPDDIYDVIYQPGQFAAVDDGQINLTPNDTSYQAAKEALSGRDPSLGALFFYNPRTARTLWWLTSRETTVQIGDHVFAK
ncbi:cell wall hydrolase [Natroniella sulfidigena]|uniref:cell wall hydrolase n=1 Tax=Natroniella sulfidigena TaxID=723921 RepID=UPI00200A3E6E|nr:cell wall hydrolase [Natroniella sulfidigena]MCK8817705.1 cell wall hydrolase [Natroniella sulfidigena]